MPSARRDRMTPSPRTTETRFPGMFAPTVPRNTESYSQATYSLECASNARPWRRTHARHRRDKTLSLRFSTVRCVASFFHLAKHALTASLPSPFLLLPRPRTPPGCGGEQDVAPRFGRGRHPAVQDEPHGFGLVLASGCASHQAHRVSDAAPYSKQEGPRHKARAADAFGKTAKAPEVPQER